MSMKKCFDRLSDRKFLSAANLGPMVLVGLLVASIAGCRSTSALEQSVPTTTPGRVQQASLYRFVPGERLIYRLNYTSVSAADFHALFQDQKRSGAKTEPQATAGIAQSFKT